MAKLSKLADWEFTPEMQRHLLELITTYGAEEVITRLYVHVYWDDCTPGAGKELGPELREFFRQLLEEG